LLKTKEWISEAKKNNKQKTAVLEGKLAALEAKVQN
jgi:hypothetical protein